MQMPYDDPSFTEAWSSWIEYKKEIKHPYKTDKSAQTRLKWFTKKGLTLQQAIDVIETSIMNGWMGLFEPKNNINGSASTTTSFISDREQKPGTSEARIEALRKW